MSEYVIQGQTLTGIADAIRAQLGTEQRYTPESMAAAIGSIQGGSTDMENMLVSGEGLTTYENNSVLTVRDTFFQNTNIQSAILKKVETLKSSAFYNCALLDNLVIPNCTFVGANALRRCPKLKIISIKGGTIGLYSMQENESLIAICITGETVSTLQGPALNETPIASGTGYIYVPDDLVTQYQVATNWATYASQIKGLSEIPEEVQQWINEQGGI